MSIATESATESARIAECIKQIPDPELPTVTIGDLGMVREVKVDPATRRARVLISPTYTGCPATALIMQTVRETLQRLGFEAEVSKALFPPWSSDWISRRGRQKLREAGIAPPAAGGASTPALFAQAPAACTHCGSSDTRRISEFGATPCKALYQCAACREPFEYFKCL